MQSRTRLGGALVLFTAILIGCALRAEDGPANSEATFVDPDSADARSYRVAGEYAIDRLMMTLITDSSAAVARQTEVAALKTFHLKDVPMKNGTFGGLPRITAFKLSSLQVRNPTNAPDAAELAALNRVRVALDIGNPPRVLVQKIVAPGGTTEWRVYKPLANIRQCGTCHGNPSDMSAELRTAIHEKYPEDKAVNYATGQWCGLIRVTVGEPPPPKPAPPLPKAKKY